MTKFIIGHGLMQDAEWDIVEASSLDQALERATALTQAKGWGADASEFEETTAEPFTVDRAYELGLIWLDAHEKGWDVGEPIA